MWLGTSNQSALFQCIGFWSSKTFWQFLAVRAINRGRGRRITYVWTPQRPVCWGRRWRSGWYPGPCRWTRRGGSWGCWRCPVKTFRSQQCHEAQLLNEKAAKHCHKIRGFVCAYHPAAPGSNPKHTIYAFFNLYWNCNENRTKINKKRPGLAHF